MKRALAIVKTLIFTILVPGYIAVILPKAMRSSYLPFVDVVAIVGALLILAGVAVYLRCAWDFAYTGLGTPAPIDPPKVLIAQGLHRFIRNPMYVGVVLVIVGQAGLFHSLKILLYGGCFFLLAHLFVIFFEEPMLERKFGASYDNYRDAVPRWFPRLRRPVGSRPEHNC